MNANEQKSLLEKAFARYRELIDDWPAFLESCAAPLPLCAWTNVLRTTPETLLNIFSEEGIAAQRLGWYPAAFRLPQGVKAGRLWAYLAGLYHIQEEIALLPVLLLNPAPGQRILDLCAAPGNKTALMSVHMQNRGTLVANDRNFRRMRAIRHTIERLGLLNISTTHYDGATYPKLSGQFDGVLVDVPCSCEGTVRKNPEILFKVNPDFCSRNAQLQKNLLKRAIQLCKPGGKIVYSTCTFAPEENEQVVHEILQEMGEQVCVEPPPALPLRFSPGITRWQGQQLDPALAQTLRIWPHQNDTGGFYVAILRKKGSSETEPPECPSVPPPWQEEPEAERWTKQLAERYGLNPEEAFREYRILRRGKEGLYLVAYDHQPPQLPIPDSIGMFFLRTQMVVPKLSTGAAMLFAPHISRNRIGLKKSQLDAYFRRETFPLSPEQWLENTTSQQVLVTYQSFGLGIGQYRKAAAGNVSLQSLFPKGWSPDRDKLPNLE